MLAEFTLLPEAVGFVDASDKATVLTLMAQRFAAAYGLDPVALEAALHARERLGSTGFGRGIALPHARMADVKRPTIALLRLRQPIDFAAADALPVHLVFGLVSPETSGTAHLHALAALSRLARDEAVLDALLAAEEEDALFAVMTNRQDRDAA